MNLAGVLEDIWDWEASSGVTMERLAATLGDRYGGFTAKEKEQVKSGMNELLRSGLIELRHGDQPSRCHASMPLHQFGANLDTLLDIEEWRAEALVAIKSPHYRISSRGDPRVLANIANLITRQGLAMFKPSEVRAATGKGSLVAVHNTIERLEESRQLVKIRDVPKAATLYRAYMAEDGWRATFRCAGCGEVCLHNLLEPLDTLAYALRIIRYGDDRVYCAECRGPIEIPEGACVGCGEQIAPGDECWVNQRAVCFICFFEFDPDNALRRLRGCSVVSTFDGAVERFETAVAKQ